MSQNDFNLANQGFPAMRADMNSAFQALASNSSGATEPGTTYAYQWWYDTNNDILKMRNADDDAWINIASFDQANDTWSPYVGATALTATGAELNQLDADSTGALKVPTGTVAQRPTPAQGQIRFNSDDTTFEGYDGTAWGEIGGSVDFSAVAADIIPDADSTRDIGSTSTRWAQGWFDDVTSTNTSDGTLSIPTTYVTNGSAKAWNYLTGATGTPSIGDSFNVSSIADEGTGLFRTTLTNALTNTDFGFSSIAASGSVRFSHESNPGVSRTTSSSRTEVRDASGTQQDPTSISYMFYGDLA